jgi:3-methyladenine DNA glycosylase AlkD
MLLIEKEIEKLKNPEKAKLLQRFFKTGKGEYGEGDIFLGIAVPESRKIVKQFSDLLLRDIQILLDSKIHEKRFIALLILVKQFERANKIKDEKEQKGIFEFYLKNTKDINNWDLVDLSAPRIIGMYLLDKDKSILYKLAKSNNLWEKRISILSTFWFIKENRFEDAIKLAEILLNDQHDLMHKAVGWMLRETGKKDKKVLINFLNKHYKIMPRTMLRYSIERLSKEEKKFYMKKD